MSEPDEALIWARENAAGKAKRDGKHPLNVSSFLSGKRDYLLFRDAEAYRAGRAASAERIKALEAEVAFSRKIAARCAEELEWVKLQRALLKEADQ